MPKSSKAMEAIHKGAEYGLLTVLGISDIPVRKGLNSVFKVECFCECGVTSLASPYDLLSGKKKSCGCLVKKMMSKTGKRNRIEDFIGRKFNSLTVIGFTASKHRVLCRCDCGVEKELNRSNVRSGSTQSCGCSKYSAEAIAKRTKHLYRHGLSKNLEYKRLVCQKRRNTIKRANGSLTAWQTEALVKKLVKNIGECIYCGKKEEALTIDHFFPVSRGGRHTIDNIVLACGHCNASKSNNLFHEWAARKFGKEFNTLRVLTEIGLSPDQYAEISKTMSPILRSPIQCGNSQ